ncbi:MAG TPA: hypothetical protein VFZ51_03380 [Woeseiaceae bacterium]
MATKALFSLSILFTAIAMAAGFAHLLEMPNKMHLSREDYLTVQQINRGWAGTTPTVEYSHAVSAGLYFVALTALTFATLVERE